MAEYIVPTKEHGRVKVNIGSIPKDPVQLRDALKDEILAGRFEAVPETPEAQGLLSKISTAYSSVAKPATAAVQDAIETPARAILGAKQDDSGEWVTAEGERLSKSPLAEFAAKAVVPQNLAELGIMAGTLGAGGVVAKAGLTGIKASLARVLGSTTGGTAGGVVEGDPVFGAFQGLISGTLGETVGVVLDRLYKTGSARVSRIVQDASADDFGRTMGSLPALRSFQMENSQIVGRGENVFAGRTTPEAIRDLVLGDKRTNGKAILGRELDKVNEAIENLLPKTGPGGYGPGHLFRDPQDFSVGRAASAKPKKGDLDYPSQPPVPNRPLDDIYKTSGPIPGGNLKLNVDIDPPNVYGSGTRVNTDITSGEAPGRYVQWREVRSILAEMYDAAYGSAKQANPITASAKGVDPKKAYAAAVAGVRRELDTKDPSGQALVLFDAGQELTRTGLNLLKNLRPAFNDFNSKRVVFDIAALQRHFSKKQALISEQLGSDTYDTMARSVFWGQRPGLADEPIKPTPQIGLFAGGITSPHAYGSHLERLLSGPQLVGDRLDLTNLGRTAITVGTERATAPLADFVRDR